MDAAVGRHRAMLVAVGVLALAVVAGAVLLWPRGEANRPAEAGQQDPTRLVSATLTRVQQVPCKEADPGVLGSTCGPASRAGPLDSNTATMPAATSTIASGTASCGRCRPGRAGEPAKRRWAMSAP